MTAISPQRPQRSSGLLLHPTSLPGGHGCGDLGPDARRFVDFLAEAGQNLWQIMPLGPPGYGESPYAARSAFAGNPLLISLEALAADGLLTAADLAGAADGKPSPADFAGAEAFKGERLRRACHRLRSDAAGRQQLADFIEREQSWLPDYALFMALRDQHGGREWTSWPPELVRREGEALAKARAALAHEIDVHAFAQWAFFRQWGALRTYANEQGVRIIGDVPIFVAHDSADVWARQDLFHLDARGQPTIVAGVPPDAFSRTGQRWGNPLYRWDVLEQQGFGWWVERFRALLATVDIVRVDHFRGFQASWHIPAQEETAVKGKWVETPGRALFAAVRAALGDFPIIAEDLGLITPKVEALRLELGFPGMRVLQFAFGGGPENLYLPHNHAAATVTYTGTHDNDTTVGWYHSQPEKTRDHVRRYFGIDGHDIAWDFIRAALASVAEMAIIPVQDVLALGGEARMNFPGRPHGNWAWRLTAGALTHGHAVRLRHLSELYGRNVVSEDREAGAVDGADSPPDDI